MEAGGNSIYKNTRTHMQYMYNEFSFINDIYKWSNYVIAAGR